MAARPGPSARPLLNSIACARRSASTVSQTKLASDSTFIRKSTVSLLFVLRHQAELTESVAGPSIGKLDAAAAAIEPQARGTLFSTSNARKAPASPATPEAVANPLSAAAMRMPAYPTSENPWAAADGKPDSAAPLAPQHDIDVQALAQQAALQRPQFAVDEATEGEGEEWVGGEGGEGGEGDEGLLGQVDAMLQAEPAGAGT